MTDLDSFRSDTRAWLEANCPAEMRSPFRSEEDVCWGGRNWTFASDAQRNWLDAMAGRGWTVPDWPADYGGCRRPRPLCSRRRWRGSGRARR